jgi:hypothetical protein
MDLLKIGLILVAVIVTASGVASVYFRRDNSTNWLVVLTAVWLMTFIVFAFDFGY